jgi:hypothetical protein
MSDARLPDSIICDLLTELINTYINYREGKLYVCFNEKEFICDFDESSAINIICHHYAYNDVNMEIITKGKQYVSHKIDIIDVTKGLITDNNTVRFSRFVIIKMKLRIDILKREIQHVKSIEGVKFEELKEIYNAVCESVEAIDKLIEHVFYAPPHAEISCNIRKLGMHGHRLHSMHDMDHFYHEYKRTRVFGYEDAKALKIQPFQTEESIYRINTHLLDYWYKHANKGGIEYAETLQSTKIGKDP